MENITRTSAFVRLARLLLTLLIVVASVPACMQPQVIRHEVPVPYSLPAQLPPGAERLPLRVGIYYSPEFEDYEHYDHLIGESGVATPVGEFSIRQFDSMFFAMFEHTQFVDRRPPYPANDPASELHAIIEPRIERFEMDAENMSFAPLVARVDYRFKVYLPDGTTLATWEISASDTGVPWSTSWTDIIGVRTKTVVRESSIQFMQEFSDSPKVKVWLAEIRKRESEARQVAKTIDATFDVNTRALASGAAAVLASTTLDGVDVSASLYWQVGLNQVPIEDSSVKNPVIATRLTIKNNRADPIVFDPSNLRLRTNRFATLTPDSAQIVAQRMLRGSGGDDGDTGGAVAAIFLGAVGGAMASTFAAIDQANVKDDMLRMATDELRREQLDGQTIAPNQTVSGIAYFVALGIDRNLDEPELLVSIVDPSQRKSYETTLNMTTGTATGGALLLAGLKPPESVTEKTEVVEAPQPVEDAVETTRGPLRVGILPPAFLNPTLPSNDDKESGIYSEIRRYVHSKPNFDLSYDYGAREGAGLSDTHAVWQGSVVKKVPDKAKMQAVGEELDVDVLVLAWITGNRANTIIDLYVYEVASGRMSHDTDGLGGAKGLVASMFGPVERQQARLRDSTISATGGTLLLAGSKPPGSTTGTTEKAAGQQQAEETADTTTGPLRVGILPPLSGGSSRDDEIQGEIYKEIRRYIASDRSFDLSFDYTARYGAGSLDTHAVWQGTVVKKVPDEAKLRVIGEELGADILVLTTASGVTSYGGRIDVYLYVFDVASGKMYQGTDNVEQVKGLVASTFGPIKRQQTRQRAGNSAVASVKREPIQSTVHTQSRRQLLNPTELRTLLAGNTLTGQTGDGIKYHVYYRTDGIMYGVVLSGRWKGKRDDGHWEVREEMGYCRRWSQWLSAEKHCFNVFQYDDSLIFEQNSGSGGRKSRDLVRKGNPENL